MVALYAALGVFALTLIGELLHLSRQSDADQALEREPVALAELLAVIIDDARLEAEAQGKAIDAEVDPGLVADLNASLMARAVENVVRKRRGAGTYVSETASPLARQEQRRILAERADALLAEARQMRFTLDDVHALLEERQGLLDRNTSTEEGHANKKPQ